MFHVKHRPRPILLGFVHRKIAIATSWAAIVAPQPLTAARAGCAPIAASGRRLKMHGAAVSALIS